MFTVRSPLVKTRVNLRFTPRPYGRTRPRRVATLGSEPTPVTVLVLTEATRPMSVVTAKLTLRPPPLRSRRVAPAYLRAAPQRGWAP
jgi:hypothetical protein